ncbi:MAG: hypothetical protein JWO42_2555 [Chloroflexi bacterium]|nr:hypothetical protein [Chloroflexota bacterium]
MEDDRNNGWHNEEEGLYDGRSPFVHWSRLLTGLFLIAAAVILLVVENHVGIVATSTHGGTASPTTQLLPGMATPETIGNVAVVPKFIGRQDSVGGSAAGNGKRFWILAVRVTNEAHRAVAVSPADFTITAAGPVIAPGRPYPGHTNPLWNPMLQPGATAQGVLVFAVTDNSAGATLTYTQRGARTGPARWSLP